MRVPARLLPPPHLVSREESLENSLYRLRRNGVGNVTLDSELDVVRKNDPFGPGKTQSGFGLASGSGEGRGGVCQQFRHLQPVSRADSRSCFATSEVVTFSPLFL